MCNEKEKWVINRETLTFFKSKGRTIFSLVNLEKIACYTNTGVLSNSYPLELRKH